MFFAFSCFFGQFFCSGLAVLFGGGSSSLQANSGIEEREIVNEVVCDDV